MPHDRISIQLYTLRDAMGGQPGFDTVLTRLAQYGYEKVEFAGYYGRTAQQIRDQLDDLGIRASSSHEGISADAAALHTKLENAVTLGQRYVVVPYLNSNSLSDWKTWAEQMNAEAAVAKEYGLRYGYHNHAHEFTIDLGGGLTPWEVLTSRLDPQLVHLEVDLYWAYTGGVNTGAADPDRFAIEVIREAPQRVRQFHVKDRDGGHRRHVRPRHRRRGLPADLPHPQGGGVHRRERHPRRHPAHHGGRGSPLPRPPRVLIEGDRISRLDDRGPSRRPTTSREVSGSVRTLLEQQYAVLADWLDEVPDHRAPHRAGRAR